MTTAIQPVEKVCDIYPKGSEGFVLWREQGWDLDDAGIRCPVCQAFRADRRDEAIASFDGLVVSYLPRKIPFGPVSNFYDGLVVRDDFLEVIGREKCEALCHFKSVFLKGGRRLEDHSFLIERSVRGKFRGTLESKIKVCGECGRLLYWPMPMDRWYLLRQYWDGAGDVTILDSNILCAKQYVKATVSRFPGIKYRTYALADTPSDGLPADFAALIAEVRERGKVDGSGVRDRKE